MLGDEPTAVGLLLGLGQVAVLVEYGGQCRHLLGEGEMGHAGPGALDPPEAPLLEEVVDQRGVGTAQVPEQFGGEIAVALGVERFGRRRERVAVRWPAPAGSAGGGFGAHEQSIFFQVDELEADGGGSEAELSGQPGCVQGALALEQVEDGPTGGRQRGQRGFGHGRIFRHGRMRCTSPNSCHW